MLFTTARQHFFCTCIYIYIHASYHFFTVGIWWNTDGYSANQPTAPPHEPKHYSLFWQRDNGGQQGHVWRFWKRKNGQESGEVFFLSHNITNIRQMIFSNSLYSSRTTTSSWAAKFRHCYDKNSTSNTHLGVLRTTMVVGIARLAGPFVPGFLCLLW